MYEEDYKIVLLTMKSGKPTNEIIKEYLCDEDQDNIDFIVMGNSGIDKAKKLGSLTSLIMKEYSTNMFLVTQSKKKQAIGQDA